MGTDREAKIVRLTLGLVVMTGLIVLFQFDQHQGYGTARLWQWLALVAAFAAAEIAVISVNLRSQQTAFTAIEVPLFLGAVFVSPSIVWSAMGTGIAIAVFGIQRAPLLKSAFNMANLTLQGALGLLVFHLLVDGVATVGPRVWMAASLAAALSSAVAASALVMVLLIVEDHPDLSGLNRAVVTSSLISVANVSIALIAATLITHDPWSVLLLVLPMIVMFGAYRAYVAEQAQRERVQAMHELALEIRSIRDHTNVAPVLQLVAEHLGALRSELVLFPSPDGERAVRFRATASECVVGGVGSRELDQVVGRANGLLAPAVTEPDDAGAPAAIAGTIRGDDRPIGLLTVTDRLRSGSSFGEEDTALFSTIIEQLGLTFERHELGIVVSELEARERMLEHVAHHDPLTGLANRALLRMELDAALAEDRPTTLLYVDLDDFKVVNDLYGHDAGDEVLRELAGRFARTVGVDDCVARLGGDEFVVLLDEPADDVRVAQKLLDATSEPIDLRDGTVQVHASIGVARATSDAQANELIKQADAAMYEAKGRGKGSLAISQAREHVWAERPNADR